MTHTRAKTSTPLDPARPSRAPVRGLSSGLAPRARVEQFYPPVTAARCAPATQFGRAYGDEEVPCHALVAYGRGSL
jgi:hypothetical protein